MFRRYLSLLSVPFLVAGSLWQPAQAEPLEIYIDGDYSIMGPAAQSIELGVRTALEEVDYRLGGVEIAVVPRDHRGNVKRSLRTMKHFVQSDNALAVVGGLHSPPYLTNKDFMNENRVLTLLPWSAAGPITRASDGMENWIFRLSVDDLQSGGFLIQEALERGTCTSIALVLLETGWGRANHATLTAALEERGMAPATVQFFPAAVGTATARTVVENVARSGADCAVLLSNWDDGYMMTNALHQRVPTIQLFSHWGIMGGNFAAHVDHSVRTALNISVLQTCGLRREKNGSPVLSDALGRAAPDASELSDISAPTGFVHGYDLTRILIAAAEQAAQTPEWSGDIKQKRNAIRTALENLENSVDGILATYASPFGPYGPDAKDAHEALGRDDLCLARFREDGRLEDAG